MKEPVNPIDNLRDIHLPVEPGWWPPAIGWWIVAAIFLLLGFWVLRSVFRWYQRGESIRAFRSQLQSISVNELSTAADRQNAIASILSLIKRFCIRLFGRDAVATLHGQPLLELLDKISASDQFTGGPGRMLADGAYRADIDGDVLELKKLVLKKLTRRQVLRAAKRLER